VIYTQDYWKLPPRTFALHIVDLTEADFNFLCAWVTQRVPDAEVWNIGIAGPGGAPSAEEPNSYAGYPNVKITHPDHPDFGPPFVNIAFIDGWFTDLGGGYARYPHEWSSIYVDGPSFPRGAAQ